MPVAFALDCCGQAMSDVSTTAGITGEDGRDLMVAVAEHRFGSVNPLPSLIEWLTDDSSRYVARDTRRLARELGPIPERVHFMRNALAHAGRSGQRRVFSAFIATAFAQEDAEAARQQ